MKASVFRDALIFKMFTILNSSDIIEEMNNLILAPSLLSADFSELKNAIKLIEDNNGKAVHIDVMDGIFVPQISYGEPVVKSIRHLTSLPFDVHLMIEHPENHIDSFAKRAVQKSAVVIIKEAILFILVS